MTKIGLVREISKSHIKLTLHGNFMHEVSVRSNQISLFFELIILLSGIYFLASDEVIVKKEIVQMYLVFSVLSLLMHLFWYLTIPRVYLNAHRYLNRIPFSQLTIKELKEALNRVNARASIIAGFNKKGLRIAKENIALLMIFPIAIAVLYIYGIGEGFSTADNIAVAFLFFHGGVISIYRYYYYRKGQNLYERHKGSDLILLISSVLCHVSSSTTNPIFEDEKYRRSSRRNKR